LLSLSLHPEKIKMSDSSAAARNLNSLNPSRIMMLAGATREELVDYASEKSMPAYRGRQIADWIYKKFIFDPEQMSSLPKELRENLAADFTPPFTEISRDISDDGVIKCALKLHDGEIIEMVAIPAADGRSTLCLSTQVGCAVGCRFCASGANGLRRNLSKYEMLSEFVYGCQIAGKKCDNIVFMGIGEGMMNFDSLAAALDMLTSPDYFAMSPRRITVSTSGFVPGMLRFAELKKEYTLAISLHAVDEAVRDKIIPPSKCRYPISEILDAADAIRNASNRDFTIEYTLVEGINDSVDAARKLAAIAKKHHAKINLIPCNAVSGEMRRPQKAVIEAFQNEIASLGARVTRRVERGSRTVAACGQLRIKLERKS
jgi:23S rRNA (adenine2503-C2)-methyltransferase